MELNKRNDLDIMMLSSDLERALLGDRKDRNIITDMPWLTLPEGYSFKVTFPFSGAAARFRVCKTDNPERDVSVYLDTQHVLGYFGMPGEPPVPYWEAYPVEGDTQMFALSEGKELIEAIVKELSSNNPFNWTPCHPYQDGDLFTMQGRYNRRTLWEWLTQQPRQLQVFRVIGEASIVPGGITEYEPTNQ